MDISNNTRSQSTQITRTIRGFYEKFPFPGLRPIDQDGLILIRRLRRHFEIRRKAGTTNRCRILDAGCGTGNTSISLAGQFAGADFVGVDLSGVSLAQAKQAGSEQHLSNLQFRRMNLMNPLSALNPFDIILCLGVLHHTADMERGLKNLREVLKPEGELYLWIYGRHGRYRHTLNRRLLEILLDTLPAGESKLALAREFAARANHGSVIDDLLGSNAAFRRVLQDPVWIADQFLNPNEILLDMEGLIHLSGACGFRIEKWFGVGEVPSVYFNSPMLAERFTRLSRDQQRIALDLLLKPERYFVALRPTSEQKG
jgi:2-polyprenyl-3-methyl-5-hydroxy-6-metoxy-1,4-benzoquinol methylase